MNSENIQSRLRAMLSDLSEHLTDEQFEHAVSAALEVTGVALPTTVPEKVEAVLNRGEALCLQMLQNDWLPRFDFKYGSDELSRSDVASKIETKLNRLERRWEHLSRMLWPEAGDVRKVEVRTAGRA